MTLRILGIVTALYCAALLVVSILALRDAEQMARALPRVAEANEASLDGEDWGRHWRVSSVVTLLWSLGGTVAGVGMVLRLRWSVLLLASVAGGLLLFKVGITASGYATYAFELGSWGELAILGAVVAASLVAYFRWRQEPHSDERRPAERR